MNTRNVVIAIVIVVVCAVGIYAVYDYNTGGNISEKIKNYSANIGQLGDTEGGSGKSNSNSVDDGIYGLNYDKNVVLANNGDKVENVIPNEGKMENDKFIVLKHEKKSLSTAPVDISVVDSIMDRTYPGAILLGNRDFVDNRPTLLAADRKPIKISVDLPGLENKNALKVKNPSYSKVNAAINTLIDTWAKENSDTHTVPARTQYSETMVYSRNQLKMGLNMDIKVVDQQLGIDFQSILKSESKYMVSSYKQIFFTASVDLPTRPSDLFNESVTFGNLTSRGVGNDSPPLLVNNVAYGRTIYVVLKTNSQSAQVEAAFKALIKGQKIETNSEFENIIENSSFTAVVLGGDAAEHNKIITTDFEEIRNVIKNNAAFSLKNPGYPISYTSSFVKDNSVAAVHNYTDYVETTSTEYSQCKLTLDHSGAYVARYNVQWDELTYDDTGKAVYTHKNWDGNDKDRTAHWSTVINIPPNARNIKIKAIEQTGLVWEGWRTVVDEVNVPLAGKIRVSIWGTTLSPKSSIDFE